MDPNLLPKPLKPLAPFIHEEVTNLEHIETLQDGVCVVIYYNDGSPRKFMTLESTYIKGYLKEEYARDKTRIEKVRMYREMGTLFEEGLKDQLEDYKIPQDLLDFRNDGDDNPIDENGLPLKKNSEPTE